MTPSVQAQALIDEPLDDEALIAGFEGATLAPGSFQHAEHVRVAWLYFQRYEPAAAMARFARHIKQLVTALGAEDKYHETITWAYLLLIWERYRPGESWPAFAARGDELFDPKGAILGRYYSPESLAGDSARRGFVMPDRGPRDSASPE